MNFLQKTEMKVRRENFNQNSNNFLKINAKIANCIKQQSVKAIALFSTSLIHDYVGIRT